MARPEALAAQGPLGPILEQSVWVILKAHLGIETKSAEVIAWEDEALGLYRQKPPKRPAGEAMPAGGLSYREIGKRLGRSSRWAALAVASAKRREEAKSRRCHSADRRAAEHLGKVVHQT